MIGHADERLHFNQNLPLSNMYLIVRCFAIPSRVILFSSFEIYQMTRAEMHENKRRRRSTTSLHSCVSVVVISNEGDNPYAGTLH